MESPPQSREHAALNVSGNGRGRGLEPDAGHATSPVLVPPQPAAAAPPPAPRWALWTQRLFLVIFVVFCLELGMLLAVLPWTEVWTKNGLLDGHPELRAFLGRNFIRGLMSGFGVIDIWIGIWEAVHYREK